MKKILTILFITALMVMVAGKADALRPPEPKPPEVQLAPIKQKLDPQAILENWQQAASQCYGMVNTPDEMRVVHIHMGIFINPDENGIPEEVTMFFNPETREAFSIIWEENRTDYVHVKYGDVWKQMKPDPPRASEGR